MITRITILFCLFFAGQLIAQNNQLLIDFDEQTGELLNETDKNKYNYTFPKWVTLSEKIFSATNDSLLNAFEFKNLNRLRLPSAHTTIFYFIKNRGITTTFNWIAKQDGKDAISFCDAIAIKALQKPTITERIVRDLHGFEIKDSVSEELIFWVPDVEARILFETLADTHSADSIKNRASEIIDIKLSDLWYTDEAITQQTNGFPRLFTVENETKTVRVASYMITYADFSSKCSGFVMHKNEHGSIVTEKLKDIGNELKSEERVKTKATNWVGAVYTALIETTFNKQKYYTLLGYKSSDGLIKTRVIDILWFKKNQSYFGAPLFLHEKATYHRRIFRYSSEANMLIRYDTRHKRIVFDHLSPTNTMFVGEYRFYGPDFSYDSYEINKDGWHFKEDVDFHDEQKK